MAVVIRFEDRYGMADIAVRAGTFKRCRCYLDSKVGDKEVLCVDSNTYVQVGKNTGVMFILSEQEAEEFKKRSIAEIVFVIDLDNRSGNKKKILEVSEFKDAVCIFRGYMHKYNLNLNLHFVPVMYAAETVYLYLLYNCKRNPCEIVSAFNTNKVHGALVAAILGRKKIKDAKCIREQLDKLDVTTLLQKELSKNRYGNTKTLNWLLESGDLLKYTFTEEEMIKYLEDANHFFEEQKVQGPNIIRALGDQFDCNDEDSVKAFIWRHSRKS